MPESEAGGAIGSAIWISARGRPSASSNTGSRSRSPIRSSSIPGSALLGRRGFRTLRQATENRRGQRHDRSAQQMEYHGLRDYRSGATAPGGSTGERRPAPRRADGQGIRAAERTGPGDPGGPVAAADQAGHVRAAGGRGAGDLVRRHGLPGDLPATRRAGPSGGQGRLQRPGTVRRRSSSSTNCSSSLPCSARRPRERLPS